jgi:hypothetical protein
MSRMHPGPHKLPELGKGETSYVAQRMSQRSVATQRRRTPNVTSTPTPTASHYCFLEAGLIGYRLSILRDIQ